MQLTFIYNAWSAVRDSAKDALGISDYAHEKKVWEELGLTLPREIFYSNKDAFNFRSAVLYQGTEKTFTLEDRHADVFLNEDGHNNELIENTSELVHAITKEMKKTAAQFKIEQPKA